MNNMRLSSDKLKGKYKVHPVEKTDYKRSEKVGRFDERGGRDPDEDSFDDVRKTLEGRSDSVEIGGEVPDPGTYSREDVAGDYESMLEDLDDIYTGPAGRSIGYSVSVEKESMPGGLFGWTRPGTGKVHVSDNLYSKDEKETIRHEKTHLMFPGKDELTIRYINGDTDPENTLSSNYMHQSDSY